MSKKQSKKKLKNMSKEEILDELIFPCTFKMNEGPPCSCTMEKLVRFHGELPDKLLDVETGIDDCSFDNVPEFESKCSSLCSCQRSHFFDMSLKKNKLTLVPSKGKEMDGRVLRLPNYR